MSKQIPVYEITISSGETNYTVLTLEPQIDYSNSHWDNRVYEQPIGYLTPTLTHELERLK